MQGSQTGWSQVLEWPTFLARRIGPFLRSLGGNTHGKDRLSGFAIVIILLLTIIVIAGNLIDLISGPVEQHAQTRTFLLQDLLVAAAWFSLYLIHRKGYPRLASALLLITLIAFTAIFFNYHDLHDLLVMFAIPILIASFILSPASSFLLATASALALTLSWIAYGMEGSLSILSISVFYGLAALSWAAADQYNHMIARLQLEDNRLRATIKLYQMQDAPGQVVIHQTMEECIRLTDSDRGYLAFLDQDESLLTLYVWARVGSRICQVEYPEALLGVSETGGWIEAIHERRPVIVNDLQDTLAPLTGLSENAAQVWRHLNVPVTDGGKIAAVVGVANKPRPYDESDANQVLLLMNQLWGIMSRGRMIDRLENTNRELVESYEATLKGWAHALEIRNKETQEHTRRVTALAESLARALGMAEGDLEHFKRGVMLHDIGKIAVPDAILQKRGPLDEDEWEVMRRHPSNALELLAPIKYLNRALDVPYAHHERWNGSGYPRGLRGEEIPWPARIFAVVDVWDALTSDRPYRSAWSYEKAALYLRDQMGVQFDPAITTAFLDVVLPTLLRNETSTKADAPLETLFEKKNRSEISKEI